MLGGSLGGQGVIPMEELKEYIAYSRAHCKPELTNESAAALVEGYLSMRSMGISRKVACPHAPPPPPTPRSFATWRSKVACFWCRGALMVHASAA